MTLTASFPTKALASVLAALLLSTALAVAVPTRTELPSVLGALELAPAQAHTHETCSYYTVTVYPNGRNGPGAYSETRRRCVNVDHSHAVRDFLSGAGITIGCAIAAPTGVGAAACSLLIGGAYIGAMANQSK